MTDEFLDKLDELSVELKKLSDRDRNIKYNHREIAKNALDNIDEIDKTITIIDQIVKEKNTFVKPNLKSQVEIDALYCYKEKLLNTRKEWLIVAERNLTKNKTKVL